MNRGHLAAGGAASSHDVVIVGARAAGAATAFLLSRAGLDVLLVDRCPRGTDTMSTHTLMHGAVVQLQRWGLLERIVAAGTPPIDRVTFHHAHGVIPMTVRSHGLDSLYAPRRTVLDPVLVDAAVAHGADVRHGIIVTDVDRSGSGRVVGVRGRTSDGDGFRATGRIVIGADGLRSRIADLVGAPVERVGRAGSAIAYGYWDGLPTDGYEWNLRPGAVSAAVRTNDGLTCVLAATTPQRLEQFGPDVLERVVAESSPDLAHRMWAAVPASAVRMFAGAPGHVRRSHGPGWALVGDAGHHTDPLGSHGISHALRDAELLARAVVEALDDDAGKADALAAYQSERDALATDLFDVADTLATHRWTDAEVPTLVHRLHDATVREAAAIAELPAVATQLGAGRGPLARWRASAVTENVRPVHGGSGRR